MDADDERRSLGLMSKALRFLGLVCLAAQVVGAAPPPAKPWDDSPIASTYRTPPSSPLLIRDATVLDGLGHRIENGDVLIQGGKIVAVGANLPQGGAREIDGRGRWVTPGIIDPHSHDGTYVVPLTDIDGYASDVSEGNDINVADTWIETAVNPQDPAFSRALRSGVTTLQILPGSAPVFGGHSVIVKPVPSATLAGMKMPGAPIGFKMACGENPKSKGGEASEHKDWPTSRQGVYAYMQAAFADARARLGRLRAGQSVNFDAKTAALAGILAGDIRLHMHCYRASDMAAMAALSDEFGFHIAAFHHASEAYKIVGDLKKHGICSAVWSDWWGFKLEIADAIRANAPILEQAGACVMMHSDSPDVGQRLNLEAAKAAAAGRRIGIETPPETMIRWITSTPAKILGIDSRVGTLAPGMEADVVLWSGDPFSVYSRPDIVFVGGAALFERSTVGSQPLPDFELGRPDYAEPSQ
jgi:imidazolonepropionase-like amidohydrolase